MSASTEPQPKTAADLANSHLSGSFPVEPLTPGPTKDSVYCF